MAKKDTTAAEHEYSKVSIAKTKVDQLRTEAEQCIGQLAFRTDENLTVEVEVPSGLPTEDPTNPPTRSRRPTVRRRRARFSVGPRPSPPFRTTRVSWSDRVLAWYDAGQRPSWIWRGPCTWEDRSG